MSGKAGCLGFLFGKIGSVADRDRQTMPKVMINKFFVTNAEADFYRVLCRVVGTKGHILAQVSLGQLLYLPGSNQTNPGRGAWWNKICRRSIDFVICDPATLRPLLAIELDEPSHAKPERQTRDEEVGTMINAAGLPFVRVLTSRAYETRELSAVILPLLNAG